MVGQLTAPQHCVSGLCLPVRQQSVVLSGWADWLICCTGKGRLLTELLVHHLYLPATRSLAMGGFHAFYRTPSVNGHTAHSIGDTMGVHIAKARGNIVELWTWKGFIRSKTVYLVGSFATQHEPLPHHTAPTSVLTDTQPLLPKAYTYSSPLPPPLVQ